MADKWEQLIIRATRIGNGVVIRVCAGEGYADTALPDMHFADLEAGLVYAVEQARDPDQIIATGKADDEGPF